MQPESSPFTATDRINSPAVDETPRHGFHNVGPLIAELKTYVLHFASAKVDGVKASIRKLVLYAVLGVVGLLAAVALVVTSVVLVCTGIASALTLAFGYAWLGQLVTGLALLALIVGVLWVGVSAAMKSSRHRTALQYEQRHAQQRAIFGHDVNDRAKEQARA